MACILNYSSLSGDEHVLGSLFFYGSLLLVALYAEAFYAAFSRRYPPCSHINSPMIASHILSSYR